MDEEALDLGGDLLTGCDLTLGVVEGLVAHRRQGPEVCLGGALQVEFVVELAGCGGGGGDGGGEPEADGAAARWDEMDWDAGAWN